MAPALCVPALLPSPESCPAVGRIFAALGPRNVATFMGRTVQTLVGTGGLSSAARILRGSAWARS